MSDGSNYWQQMMQRRLSRRTLLRSGALIGVGVASAGSILGCGSQPKAETRTTPTSKVEEPQSGGVLTIRTAGDPPNFDLISNSTYMVQHVIAPIYNNLVRFDPFDPNKVIPDLAEKWDISPDGKTITFHLAKNVKFHDGKPCTSADVKYTFDIVREPPKGLVSPRKGALSAISGIEIVDDSTVRFVLKQANPSLFTNLAQGWMGVFPKHILQEKGDMKKDAVGTGPYMLKEYTRGVSVSLVKNPNYFKKGLPYLDGINYYIIPDDGTAFANFRSGQIHWMSVTVEQVLIAEKEFADKIVIQRTPGLGFPIMAFNGSRKPWDDVRVRQAANLAISRAEAVKVIASDDAVISGLMPPSSPWALPKAELEKIPGYGGDMAANIAQAKKLLAEAGYASGISATMLTRKGQSFEPISIFLKDQLAKIGIEAKLDVQESATAYDNLNKRAYDLAPWSHAIAVDDPDAIFGEFYTCNAERNYTSVCSKELDDLFAKQSQTLNVEERKKLVNQMERIGLMTFSRVMMYFSNNKHGLSRRVRNYQKHPSTYNNQRMEEVWLAKS